MKRLICAGLAVLALTGCKNPLDQGGPRFKTVAFACNQLQSVTAIDAAEAAGKADTVQMLLQKGCLMTRPNIEVTPIAAQGHYVQLQVTPRAMGMHMVPGMEKIEKLTLWTHGDNLNGMEKYRK